MDTGLLWICVSSLVGVFCVLTFLAVTMNVITLIFPEKKTVKPGGPDDAAVYAAISSSYARLYPGTKVSKIEEIKKSK